jgi:hypothetical protein
MLFCLVGDAEAQRAPSVEPAAEAVEVDLATFSEDVSAAAVEAGEEVPSAEAIRAAFAAGDANGDGVLDQGEVESRGTPRCSDRGVCVHGRCFCVGGYEGRAREASPEGGVAQDNPVFLAPAGAQDNAIGD